MAVDSASAAPDSAATILPLRDREVAVVRGLA